MKWHASEGDKVALARWLVATGRIEDSADAAIDVFEKTWHWEGEYREMLAEAEAERAIEREQIERMRDVGDARVLGAKAAYSEWW